MLAFWLAACASADRTPQVSSAQTPVVAYRLAPILDADGKLDALEVEIAFASQGDGSNLIRFPTRYANGPDLLPRYSGIAVAGGTLSAGERPGLWMITAPPGQRIILTYRVTSGIDHAPGSQDEQPFTPWVRDDWFIAYGQTLWARPPFPADALATFTWDGPAGFAFASDLEHIPAAGGPLGGLSGMSFSTLIGGRDIRMLRDGPIRVALHGQFNDPDAELLKMSSALIRYQRSLFDAPLADPYLVNIAEVVMESGVRGAIGGTGQGDAFSILMTRATPRSILVTVFAHETFHSWNLGETQNGEEWIHEGFTDYYAMALALRAGQLSLDEFTEVWNDRLTSYALSPARARRNADMLDRWSDADSERMQYLRGAIIAALWDGSLRETSANKVSLDDVTIEQYKRAVHDPRISRLATLRELTAANGLDIAPDIERHITNGEPISLPSSTFGPCLRIENDDRPAYDIGFDIEGSMQAGGIVQGVRQDSAAYTAGLRDGMRLVERAAGVLRDSTQPIAWIVEANGRQQTIRWLPAGEERMSVQRLIRVPDAPVDLAACGLD